MGSKVDTNEQYIEELQAEYRELLEDFHTVVDILVSRDEEIARLHTQIELMRKEQNDPR